MTATSEEHAKVVKAIQQGNSARYDVLSNLDNDQHFIGSLFPDLILLDKTTRKPVFIIEVRKNGSIAQCIQLWKSATIPATLYIIVPTNDLQNAKSIAEVVGFSPKFGTYQIEGDQVKIKYDV